MRGLTEAAFYPANLRSAPGTHREDAGKTGLGTCVLAVEHEGERLRIVEPSDNSYAWVADWRIEGVDR